MKKNKQTKRKSSRDSAVPSSVNSKNTKASGASKEMNYKIPSSLEGAFAVIVAQNALLLSDPAIDFAKYGRVTVAHLIVMGFALINCFIVITNWAACKIFYKSNAVLFCNDIITLTLIASVTNVVSEMFAPEDAVAFNQRFFFLLLGAYYVLVHILYIWWNQIVGDGASLNEKKVFTNQNIQNIISISLAFILIATTLLAKSILFPQIIYAISFLFWLYMLISFTRTFNVPMN